MNGPSRSQAVLVALVAALFVTPAAALALPTGASAQQPASNETVQPGEQFAGVVGVQGAEVEGAVEGRAFGQAIAAAESNRSKAAVIAKNVERLEPRLETLRAQREELRAAYRNGSLDRGRYRSQIATLAARINQVERQLDRSQSVAAELPEQARRAAGLNATALERLKSRASELSGGEVAEIAQTIAGPGVGRGMPDNPGGGPPDDVPGNGPGGPGQSGSDANTTDSPGQRGDGNQGGGKPDSPGQSGGGKPDSPGKSGERGPAGETTTTAT